MFTSRIWLFYLGCVLCSLCILPLRACDHSIVFVHIGEKLPSYAQVAFSQARLFNPTTPIFLLAKDSAIEEFSKQNDTTNITLIDYSTLTKTAEHKKFDASFQGSSFIRYTSERFLYLHDFIAQYSLKNVFHLENDVMLYAELEELLPIFQKHYPGIGATFDNDDRCVPGLLYIGNPSCMQMLADYFARSAAKRLHDMFVIGFFEKEINDTSILNFLPIVMPGYVEDHNLVTATELSCKDPSKYTYLTDSFGSIFDAAAVGQYLGGTDPMHGLSHPGFINESSLFNPSFLSYTWEKDTSGRFVPYAWYNNKKYRINNLHIHSKKLNLFYSLNKEIKS